MRGEKQEEEEDGGHRAKNKNPTQRFFLSRAPWSAYRCRSLVRRDERLKEDEEDAVQQISAR